MKEVLNCKCHGKPYTVCPECTHQWCNGYWHECPRCKGTDYTNRRNAVSLEDIARLRTDRDALRDVLREVLGDLSKAGLQHSMPLTFAYAKQALAAAERGQQ